MAVGARRNDIARHSFVSYPSCTPMEGRAASDSMPREWWWIFDPRCSLRARATLIFAGSAAVFTVLIAWLAGTFLRQRIEHQAETTFETLAFQVGDKLDRVIYERYRDLQLAAGLATFRDPATSLTARRELLDALQKGARDFAWIGFADASGHVLAATQGLFERGAVDQRAWFLLGRERPYAAGPKDLPALARELGQAEGDSATKFIDLAVPITAIDGQFLGVLGSQVQWEWAREVQLSVVPETARRERIGVTVYSSDGDVLLDSGGSGWTLPPDAPATRELRRPRGALLENTSEGTTYITGFAHSRGYREFRGLGWLVVVRQPVALALAPARELQRMVALWGFSFVLALGVTCWVAAGRLARRLRSIGTAAGRIQQGDILTMIPHPRGESELSHMCGSLREMVEDLREKQTALATENARLKSHANGTENSSTPHGLRE